MKYFFYSLLWLGLATGLGGCASLSYYGQAVTGHLDVMQRRQPIEPLLADPETPAALRAKLEQALAIKEFASQSLGLPDNGSYRSYADLQRPYVVWNVIATPELSLTPRQWCFPFAGCLQYRGYYDEADARAFARRLAARGDDTYVGGVSAYSTLGWFDDPVLNTMLHWNEAQLAQVLFHELAHQQVFIKGDTEFNEAFAETVGIVGTRRWLEAQGNPAALEAYETRLERKNRLLEMIFATRRELAGIYDSNLNDDVKRERKLALLAGLEQRYRELRDNGWQHFADYDLWFKGGLNNAKLAAVATYWQLVPAFMQLLETVDHDLERFYERVAALGRCPPADRRQRLTGDGLVSTCSPGGERLANTSANR